MIPVFRKVHRASTNTDHETWEPAQVANTLNVFDVAERDTHAIVADDFRRVHDPVAFQCHGSNVGPMGTLRAGNGNEAGGVPFVACPEVAHAVAAHASKGGDPSTDNHVIAFHVTQDPISGAVAPCVSQGSKGGAGVVGDADHGTVRRLTPRECERLQGFPDDYTLVSHRGKPAADGPRYRAIGNSMAVPVMAWLGRRIDLIDRIPL